MIYFLADLHGGEKMSDLKKYMDIAKDDDILIILGDIGLKFRDTEENRAFDEFFLSSKKKIAFLDGNHENFKYINSFPSEEWCGGTVHRLTENIVHLQRGFVYEINGKSIFTFGGCKSSAKWKEQGLWQPEEMPTDEEIVRAYASLEQKHFKVDYILTHKYEQGNGTFTLPLFQLCKFIDERVEFKHFYSGHWHRLKKIDEKHTIVYDSLVCPG